jgi:hypothetical protein
VTPSHLTKDQERELSTYVRDYKRRGTIGVWWKYAEAIETALAEIRRHRRHRRRKP